MPRGTDWLRKLPLAALMLAALAAGAEASAPLEVIAFGSCAREREPQPIWKEILIRDPDLFLMIGDNQYADLQVRDGRRTMTPVTDVARIREAYARLAGKAGFQRLRRHCPILATWDDHDYGANDAGADYPLRAESQQAFLDFWGFGRNAPIRGQEGIYHARTFGPEGRRVQVILLDTRYHRDPLERAEPRPPGRGPYRPTDDRDRTLLGEAQWAWLAERLHEPAELRLIASSIQVVADEHGWETWGNFPHERERLYRLIAETGATGVIFLSGDRHLMELSRETASSAPYPLWDFTSSGLNEEPEAVLEPNTHRIGPVHRETNFGVVRIHWAEDLAATAIDLEGYGDRGQLLTRQTVFLADLAPERLHRSVPAGRSPRPGPESRGHRSAAGRSLAPGAGAPVKPSATR